MVRPHTTTTTTKEKLKSASLDDNDAVFPSRIQ
jgi:hypothetical protein